MTPVAPGESHEVGGLRFTTVPAYNTREEALDFHPQANRWVGYVLELEGRTYYHAGDTDHAPELDDVRSDVAMVPIGGHYTMNAEEAAGLGARDAARRRRPDALRLRGGRGVRRRSVPRGRRPGARRGAHAVLPFERF